MFPQKKKDEEKEHEKTSASHTESEGGFGNLGALGAALASSLASNALHGNSNQGYPSQDQGGGNVLGSIFDAIGMKKFLHFLSAETMGTIYYSKTDCFIST